MIDKLNFLYLLALTLPAVALWLYDITNMVMDGKEHVLFEGTDNIYSDLTIRIDDLEV